MHARQLCSLRLASLVVGFGLLVVYAGCSSSGTTAVSVTHPTMIEVSPEDFLGSVPCTDGPGLKRYVATLIDTDYVAQGGASGVDPTLETNAGGAPVEFQLPSSLPTPCLAAVGFGLVVPGRHYDVRIDGYDTDDLAPRALGSRQLVSPATPSETVPVTALATPRWTAHCENTIAIGQTIVRADHCTTFTPVDAAAPGSVRLPLGSLLGDISCGDEPGEIDHFEVQLQVGDAAPQVETFPCATDAEAIFEGLAPRQRVSAYVTALSADGSDAFAGTSCNAFTLPEASVDADCTKLSEVGTVRVDLQGALKLLGLDCSDSSIKAVFVEVPGEEQVRSFPPPDCLRPFEHGFAPGAAGVVLTAQKPDGGEAEGAVTCGAIVTPGQLVVAECTKNTL